MGIRLVGLTLVYGVACATLGATAAPGSGLVSSRYDVTTFGAIGDGVTDDTKSIVKALDAAASDTKATVYFPPNKIFLSGPINMSTGLTLQVSWN